MFLPSGEISYCCGHAASLAIGDFSRATHLSIKTLRHYHRIGLLEPADVDPDTGHRRYTTDQIPVAQVIADSLLDMPLEEIHAVITTPDLAARNELIAGHLRRLETTPGADSGGRGIAPRYPRTPPTPRRSPSSTAGSRRARGGGQRVIDVTDATAGTRVRSAKFTPCSPSSGSRHRPRRRYLRKRPVLHERGEATVFIPCDGPVRPTGRVTSLVVPEVELALTVHLGRHTELDRAYGSLATYVTEHALGVERPIREYYIIGPNETHDESEWRTEIGWPIFHTG